jgi:hypothetical protein
MRKKAVKLGMITRGPLAGLRAELLRKGLSLTVCLVDGWNAYKPGDIVNIGYGEFSLRPDAVVDNPCQTRTQTPEKG